MKLLEVKTKGISQSFQYIILEGKKADWIALNMGEKLEAKVRQNNDHLMHGKTSQEIADHLEKQGGKYAAWYAKVYLNGEVKKMEDMYRLKPVIDSFEKNKKHIKNKDITSYTLEKLNKTLEPFTDRISHAHVNPAEDQKHFDKGHMTKHVDTPTFEVIVPHTKETACHLGKGTKWCTAADEEHNMFDHYDNEGDMYVIRAGDRRFQLHYESGQFMDEKDNEVSDTDINYLSGFPQYKEFLDMMIKKHYFDEKILKNEYKKKNSN